MVFHINCSTVEYQFVGSEPYLVQAPEPLCSSSGESTSDPMVADCRDVDTSVGPWRMRNSRTKR